MTDPYANAYSAEIERAVLTVLFDGRHPEAVPMLTEMCPSVDHFYVPRHRMIIKTVFLMALTGMRVDGVTITEGLKQIRFVDAMEKKDQAWSFQQGLDPKDSLLMHVGFELLGEIGQAMGSWAGYRTNCERLAEYRTQRELIRVLAEQLEAASATDGRSKAGKIGDAAINALSQTLGGSSATMTLDEAMGSALRLHDAAKSKGKAVVATWGLDGLNRLLPLRSGRLIVLAADTGCGKTSLALQAAVASSAHLGAGSVAIISREMPPEELATIILGRSITGGVSIRAIESGWLNPTQRAEAVEIQKRWEGSSLAIKSTAGRCTIEDATAWIRQRFLRSQGRLSLVVVDYLQLIDASNPRQQTYDRISGVSRMLKALANELRICVVLLSQLNREGTKATRDRKGEITAKPEPRKQDLQGSGSIEQDADSIVFIWTQTIVDGPQIVVNIKVDKNRGGPCGSIDAIFDKANGQTFRETIGPMLTKTEPTRATGEPVRPEDSSRAHHNHPPIPAEDKYAAMEAAAISEAIEEF